MGGHATHDEREARETFPLDLFQEWGGRDPIGSYETSLIAEGIPEERLRAIEDQVLQRVEAAAEEALSSRDLTPRPEDARYAPFGGGDVLEGLRNRPIRPIDGGNTPQEP